MLQLHCKLTYVTYVTYVTVGPCFSVQLSNFWNAIYRQLAYFFRQIARFTREQ
jgi:hypothetical protein